MAESSTQLDEASILDPSVRSFRPDVEGLRTIAILLVVLYHADIPGVRSGFVGVDVFFVISGFLITGLLLKERAKTNGTSLLRFYGRRARRILPAGTLVILATMLATYHWLGFIAGNRVAVDAKWTSVFVANIHFAAIGTQYLGSQLPPSPLQNMWSLSVEEQFYLVWPTVFLLVALIFQRISLRIRLGVVLSAIVLASFVWSIIETHQNPVWAYFSPLTRAWELALGGLTAVVTPMLRRIPAQAWVVAGTVGLVGVLASGFTFNAFTPYPGSAVALPVVSTAVVIAAGSVVVGGMPERLLSIPPFQWLGKRSYSLYLWHWPILVIAEEQVGKALPVWKNLLLVILATALSAITYRLVENPIRKAKSLQRSVALSLAMGALLIGLSFGIAQFELHTHGGTSTPPTTGVGTG